MTDKMVEAKKRKEALVTLILDFQNGKKYKKEELEKMKLVQLERIWDTMK